MCGQRVLLLVVTLFAVATALPTQSTDSIVPEIDFFNTPEVPPKQDLASVSVKHDVSCAEVPMSALQAAMEAQSVAGLPAACAACLQKSDNDGCGITHESIHEEHDEDDKGDGHDEEGHHDHGPCAPVCGDECQKPEDEFDPTKDCKKCGECYRAHGSGEAVPTFLLQKTQTKKTPQVAMAQHTDTSCTDVPMEDLTAALEAQSVAGLPEACAACLQTPENEGCGITHDHGPCAPVCGDECQKPEDEFDPTKDCKKCGECYRAHGSGEAVPTFLLHMKIFQQQKHTTAPMHPPMGSGAFPPHHEDVSCAHVPMATLLDAHKRQSVDKLPKACGDCLQQPHNDGCGIHDHGPCAPVCGPECKKPEDEFDPTKNCKKCGECYRAQGSSDLQSFLSNPVISTLASYLEEVPPATK